MFTTVRSRLIPWRPGLALMALVLGTLIIACTPATPSPTTAPAKPTEAPKPAVVTSPSPATSPAAAPKPAASPPPSPSPAPGPAGKDIALPPGYVVTEVATGFSSAIAMNLAPNGDIYVLDSGFPSFQPGAKPLPIEIWKVAPNGQKTKVASSSSGSALTGVALGIAVRDEDTIFVNDGKGLNRVRRDGSAQLVLKLPTEGDHNANHITFGKDGKLYWGQGSATNAGVVGEDNETQTGWLKANPTYHDIPCKDVTLSGKNYTSKNPLVSDPNATTETGPYLQFGTKATAGQVIRGQTPCTSSILRANADGSGLEMVAWGFRNPFGLAFSPEDSPLRGALVVSNNGSDVRGSRPIESDADDLFVISEGGWYGWPDILDELPVTEPRFLPDQAPAAGAAAADQAAPRAGVDRLLQSPGRADALGAIAHFEKGVSADGIDFSRNDSFGFKNDAFIAEWGSLGFGENPSELPGFAVSRVNFQTGPNGVLAGAMTSSFASNKKQGPAAQTGQNGFEHPVDVKFSADGQTMYVLDFGIVGTPGSGRLWAIRKGTAPAPSVPGVPSPAPLPSPSPSASR